MKTKFILPSALVAFGVSIFSTVSAFSATTSSSDPSVSNQSRTRESLYERYEPRDTTSRGNRIGKVGFLTAQPIGFAVAPIASLGVNGGYYLDADNATQIELSRGRVDLSFFDFGGDSVGVNLKHFLGNSFYVKGGGTYRSFSISNVKCYNCSADRLDLGKANSIAAEISIGNQWQWDNFTLGCDWVGVMVPLTTTGTNEVPRSTGLNEIDRKELNDAWTKLARTTSTSLLRFYLGASF